MAKYSICGHPYNDEPSMRTCLESVAGCGEELVVVDIPVPIERVLYCCGIGVSTVTVFDPFRNRPLVR